MRKFKKCLITGITGSGGSYLAEHIIKKDKKTKIFGFYRSQGYLNYLKKNYKKINFYKVDLNNFEALKKKLKIIKPDVIFHLASNPDVRGSFDKPREIILNNNNITLNLLEALRQIKINPIILICSTSEVYGSVNKKDLPITEDQNLAPINPYAVSKTFQDLISQVYKRIYNQKIIITRMFSYTNARRNNLFQTAFANQIALIEKGKKKILTHGNLNSLRSILDVEDAMNAYWLAATKGKIGEIYNISGRKKMTISQYLNELKKNSKVKIFTKIDKKLLRLSDIKFQVPSSIKFKKHTGWKENINYKDSIKKILNTCRERIKV